MLYSPIKTKPTFSFTHCVDRGGWEFEVEVEYSFDGDTAELVGVTGPYLTGCEMDHLIDHMNERAREDYAEWAAEYGEYLRDARIDRELRA